MEIEIDLREKSYPLRIGRCSGNVDCYAGSLNVYLWHIFLIKPLAALAIVVCLVTIFACFRLERRRPQQKSDKFLIGSLGLLAIYQGFRILEGVGVLAITMNSSLDDAIELLITTFYLVAAMLLRFSGINRLDAESAFRLVRAAPPRLSHDNTSRDLQIPKSPAALDALAWALPRLSDGAFKLYAYLCVVAGPAGKATVQDREVELKMKRTASELDRYCTELELSGAATVRRQGVYIEIEVSNRRAATDAPQYLAAVSEATAP